MSIRGGGLQMDKFEQVSGDHHQVLLAVEGPRSDAQGGRGLNSEVHCIMGNGEMGNPCGQTVRYLWKHYLPATSLAGGN